MLYREIERFGTVGYWAWRLWHFVWFQDTFKYRFLCKSAWDGISKLLQSCIILGFVVILMCWHCRAFVVYYHHEFTYNVKRQHHNKYLSSPLWVMQCLPKAYAAT
jgi:hypothetical protein